MNKDRLRPKEVSKLYEQQAESFAESAPRLLWWKFVGKPAFDRHLESLYGKEGVRVLDLGTGSGRVPQHLIERGIPPKNITGVEISPRLVEIARRTMPEVTFIEGDITEVELPPNSFDLVTSNMVFEFLDDDSLRRALANAARSLKPGGVLLYITTHPEKLRRDSGLERPGRFEATFPWGEKGPNYYRTLEDFVKLTEEAGLTIETTEELPIPPEAEKADPKEYERYARYPYIRLVVKARKPSEQV